MVEEKNQNEIYGSFYLGINEFSVAVKFVQEVVNSPGVYASIPLAPAYLKGLFNLRGTVIPVIDLRILLNLPMDSMTEAPKIAIIELNEGCVGLLFDKTGDVFRSHPEERSDFSDDTEGIISGVFKKDNGSRIVQILNVHRLFSLKSIPKDSHQNRSSRELNSRKRGHRKQCISFLVGEARCALPISDIQEIIKINSLGNSVLRGGYCLGAIDLRGVTVPIIDFTALLGYREMEKHDSQFQGDQRVIVMRLEKELFGLLVDAVNSIIFYFPDELVGFPIVEQSRSEMFLGCITGQGDSDFLLLDHQKILTNQEVNDITRGHSKLYRSHMGDSSIARRKSSGTRKTYITFKIDSPYAIPINEVKEIIDFPKDILRPPGVSSHVCGVLNLRGVLVTIIDSRLMYGVGAGEVKREKTKVLIFHREGVHFGLVVDDVESILTIAESAKMKLPEMLYDTKIRAMEVTEVLQAKDVNGDNSSLLILNSDAIAKKVSYLLAA